MPKLFFIVGLILFSWSVLPAGECGPNLERTRKIFNTDNHDLEITVDFWPEENCFIQSLRLQILNRTNQAQTVSVRMRGYIGMNMVKEIRIPAGQAVKDTFYLPLWNNLNGSLMLETQDLAAPISLLTLSDPRFRTYKGRGGLEVLPYRMNKYPENITTREFIGIPGIRMNRKVWDGLPENWKKNLLDWCELGGVLQIVAPQSFEQEIREKYPSAMQFTISCPPSDYGRGYIECREKEEDFEDLGKKLDAYYHVLSSTAPDIHWEMSHLEPSVMIPAIILIGFLFGPGIVFFCRKKKIPFAALFLIPVFSLLACGGIFVYAILSDGIDPKTSFMSIAFLDQKSGKIFTQQYLAVEAPLHLFETLEMKEDSMLFFRVPSHAEIPVMDGKIRLNSQIASRIPFFLASNRYEKRRERLEFRKENGVLSVLNGLGGNLKKLIVRDEDGIFWEGSGIEAGKESSLKKISEKQIPTTYAGFEWLRYESPKLFRAASLDKGVYQAELEKNVFGEFTLKRYREQGENRHLVIGRYTHGARKELKP